MRQTTARQPRADRDAFTDAVADHHRELARFAFRVEVLLPYLMRTVANEAYARHRRRKLERATEPPAAPLVEDSFEDREDETAAMLGVPRGTVKSRLSRGLDALRAIVEGSHV